VRESSALQTVSPAANPKRRLHSQALAAAGTPPSQAMPAAREGYHHPASPKFVTVIAVFQHIATLVIHGSCTTLTQERTGGPSCCTQDWAHAGPTRSHPSSPCKVLDPTPDFIHTSTHVIGAPI